MPDIHININEKANLIWAIAIRRILVIAI